MSNVAEVKGLFYPSLSTAAASLVSGETETITVLENVIGPTGFTTLVNGGSINVIGKAMADGQFPILLAMPGERLAWGKAIINVETGTHSVQNLRFSGATALAGEGQNGAGMRINASCAGFSANNFEVSGCENGLLTDGNASQVLSFSNFLLRANGYGRQGQTHNIYAGYSKQLTLSNASSINCLFGHNLKSRSLSTKLIQVHAEGSKEGRELDLSNGGILYAENCNFIKRSDALQNNLIHIGPEGVNDGRPEKYELINCLFSIDIPYGRALQFVNNQGNVECVLTDPKFVGAGGVELTADEAKAYLVGNVRVVYTGGPIGPVKPVGYLGKGVASPAPAPAPTAPVVVPPVVPPVVASPVWSVIGKEGDTISVPDKTLVRYGANGAYLEKLIAGKDTTFVATNEFFGGDPIPNVAKSVSRSSVVPVVPPVVTSPVVPLVVAPPVVVPPVVAAPTPTPVVTGSELSAAILAFSKTYLEASGYTVTKK